MTTENLGLNNLNAFKAMMNSFKNQENGLGTEGRNTALVEEQYSIQSEKPELGKHYFVAECKSCKRETAIIEDVSNGNLIGFKGQGSLRSECCHCGHFTNSKPQEIRVTEWTVFHAN